jgi:drug/metabolite transporter (DMT)-like permease
MIIYIKQLLTAVFWGGTFVAGRILANHVDAYSASFLRFAIASLVILISIRVIEGKLPGLNIKQLIGVTCLGMTGIFAYNIFFFNGLQTVTAGRAGMIISLNPVSISLLSIIFFKEKVTFLKASGITLSLSGALVVITNGNLLMIFSTSLTQGDLFIFGCVASWVSYSIIGKMVLVDLSPLVSVGYASLIGAILLFFPAVANGLLYSLPKISINDWGALSFLGVFGTALAFFWYYEGILRIGPIKTGIFINFVPISAIILAYLILDEPITVSLAVGAVMVISGVFLTNYSRKSILAKNSYPEAKWK